VSLKVSNAEGIRVSVDRMISSRSEDGGNWGMSSRETHQKILAELTGVGVNLNIFVFRLRNLTLALILPLYLKRPQGLDRTYQLVSVHENRKANMILHISFDSFPLKSNHEAHYPNIAYVVSGVLLSKHVMENSRRSWPDNNYKPTS
jgi:hypothetical protein